MAFFKRRKKKLEEAAALAAQEADEQQKENPDIENPDETSAEDAVPDSEITAQDTEPESETPEAEPVQEDVSDQEETDADEVKDSEEEPAGDGEQELPETETEDKASEENPEEAAESAEKTGETQEEESEEETSDDAPEDQTEEEKTGFFRRLVHGLTKTRKNIVSGFDNVFGGFSKIDDDFYEELEEILVMGDIGIRATEEIIENLKEKVKENHIKQPADCRQYLIDSIKEQMYVGETAYRFEEEKSVILVIGVNGVGKTTTIGKLAGKLKAQGKKVVLAAADTFRAAAGEQLTEWANRAGVDIISGQEGSDPGAVVYDAVQAAKARDADILLCDTAGRLQNKKNLMAELGKISRILDREYPGVYRETLVVLDATTGQNALSQAKQFNEVTDITGIVLTKMDGTAKGGIAVAIHSELGIPVKYIGVGETIDDLQKFDADQFVDALFEEPADSFSESES